MGIGNVALLFIGTVNHQMFLVLDFIELV